MDRCGNERQCGRHGGAVTGHKRPHVLRFEVTHTSCRNFEGETAQHGQQQDKKWAGGGCPALQRRRRRRGTGPETEPQVGSVATLPPRNAPPRHSGAHCRRNQRNKTENLGETGTMDRQTPAAAADPHLVVQTVIMVRLDDIVPSSTRSVRLARRRCARRCQVAPRRQLYLLVVAINGKIHGVGDSTARRAVAVAMVVVVAVRRTGNGAERRYAQASAQQQRQLAVSTRHRKKNPKRYLAVSTVWACTTVVVEI